ncbi:MAG: TRAP transporter small permease, partial [Roseomonas sp.]|nr:TRAP transporter small permease [Roseomonas sp.]
GGGPPRAGRGGVTWGAPALGTAPGWCFVICAFFIAFEVLGRALFGVSTGSTVEISGYMLAFGLSWSLAHALAQRGHVRIDILINRLPRAARVPLHLVSLGLLGVFIAFVAYGAWMLVDESLLFGASDISALRIPLAIPQGLWTAGLIMFLVLIIAMFVENLLLAIAGDGRQVERNLASRTYDEEAQEALEALKDGQSGLEARP